MEEQIKEYLAGKHANMLIRSPKLFFLFLSQDLRHVGWDWLECMLFRTAHCWRTIRWIFPSLTLQYTRYWFILTWMFVLEQALRLLKFVLWRIRPAGDQFPWVRHCGDFRFLVCSIFGRCCMHVSTETRHQQWSFKTQPNRKGIDITSELLIQIK